MSQRELAALADVTQSFVWMVETKAQNVTLRVVSNFAKALRTTGLQLLTPSENE